jgi:transcription initiation factor TFIIF subunit beta
MGDEAAKHLETARADRSVWLMKCPPVVSQAWQGASSSSGEANPNPVVAKVVLSLNPLSAAEPTLQARSPPPTLPSNSRAFGCCTDLFGRVASRPNCLELKVERIGACLN